MLLKQRAFCARVMGLLVSPGNRAVRPERTKQILKRRRHSGVEFDGVREKRKATNNRWVLMSIIRKS